MSDDTLVRVPNTIRQAWDSSGKSGRWKTFAEFCRYAILKELEYLEGASDSEQ